MVGNAVQEVESLELLLSKIDQLVKDLEAGKEPLNQVVLKFKQAVGLYNKAKLLLKDAQIQVEEIMKDLEGKEDADQFPAGCGCDTEAQDPLPF